MKYFKNSIILFGMAFLALSCKTLNKNISYGEMLEQSSMEARQLFNQPDYETCKANDRKEFGSIILKNNFWGRSKLKNPESGSLCSYKKGNLYGWK